MCSDEVECPVWRWGVVRWSEVSLSGVRCWQGMLEGGMCKACANNTKE